MLRPARLTNWAEKPTLLSIKRLTTVTTKAIAALAQLSTGDVYSVEAGGYVSREKAQRVIDAFNQLSGMNIKIEDIKLLPGTDAS
jgi:hypothetical protein